MHRQLIRDGVQLTGVGAQLNRDGSQGQQRWVNNRNGMCCTALNINRTESYKELSQVRIESRYPAKCFTHNLRNRGDGRTFLVTGNKTIFQSFQSFQSCQSFQSMPSRYFTKFTIIRRQQPEDDFSKKYQMIKSYKKNNNNACSRLGPPPSPTPPHTHTKHVSIFLINILLQIPSLSYWFPNTKSPAVLMTEINHFHIGNISVQYLLSQDKGRFWY